MCLYEREGGVAEERMGDKEGCRVVRGRRRGEESERKRKRGEKRVKKREGKWERK